jgi:hypothetical protein
MPGTGVLNNIAADINNITSLVKNINIHKNAETALQVNKDNGPEVNTGTCITLNI